MKHPKFSHSFEVVAEFPAALQPLRDLANNYRWSWHSETLELFRSVDKDLWEESHHNPMEMLLILPQERAQKLSVDVNFLQRMLQCSQELEAYLSEPTWFDSAYPGRREDTTIAYFCAEFGITEGLPIYSGGLGILAGDHLKAASDLGVPLVGVGLLYARGYFRQRLNHDGWQQEYYPEYDYYNFPLELMRGEDHQTIQIEVEFPDRTVSCQVWRAQVGRIPLYLLDSNVLENAASDQSITDTLYGGDEEMRIRQEMILGIGGMKALRAVGIHPTVCHMNEGHAAFLSIERLSQYMADHNCDLRTARQAVVAGNVFTTHTPVPAGFDRFTPALLERYMSKSVEGSGMDFASFLKLGRIEPENTGEAFNMAVLAMENADHVNGVAKLHAKVTRGMFAARWPEFPEDEVPVEAVTNGIHTMTWIGPKMATLFDEHLGLAWRRDPSDRGIWDKIDSIPDEEIWAIRENSRGDLVRYIRRRLQSQIERRNSAKPDFNKIGNILDPRVLTIGFARRFATYKRATLMLTDRERLKQLLFHAERPIQIVIAGKSHPRDDGGKNLIQDLQKFIQTDAIRERMVFIEDYDMAVARHLVQGVDVWLNNPRRPMEASGTSGMKVVPNGGLNCSILDGWWDEAYNPSVGFAIGEPIDVGDEGHQDWLDSRSLYGLLEQEIAPKFYHRVDNGIPSAWVAMMKRSMKEHLPFFSTARMVRQYTTDCYMPSSDSYSALTASGQIEAKAALAWRDRVRKAWPALRISKVSDTGNIKTARGSCFEVTVNTELGNLSPDDVAVEVVMGKVGANRDLLETSIQELMFLTADGDTKVFGATLDCLTPGHRGYTVRIVPKHHLVSVAHELPLVIWEG